jgi:raffinose/stachyose/melibiose transport system permease protein
MSIERRLDRDYLFMTLPALILYFLGMMLPLLVGFYFSLTDWNGLTSTMNFIGMENYRQLFDNPRFLHSMKFTLVFVLWNTIIQNILALLFALAIDSGIRGKNVYKSIIYAPCLLSPILIGYLWNRLFGQIYPQLLSFLPDPNMVNLLSNPDTVLAGLVIINNWQWIGYWMLIYLAALQSVPLDMYEAAALDGAGVLRKFQHVTLPMIMPAVTICVVAITLGGFQVYELIVTATGGGPGHASESFIMYIYNQAFASQRAAFATANSMMFVLFLLIVAVGQVYFLRRREVQA